VLFYVYPLKFIFSGIFQSRGYTPANARVMFTIYGLGFTAIFLLYALLYHHAYVKRDELQLNEIEQHDTITHVMQFSSNVVIGLVSTTVAWTVPDQMVGFAGFTYFLIGVMASFIGASRGSSRRRLEERIVSESTAATSRQTIQPT